MIWAQILLDSVKISDLVMFAVINMSLVWMYNNNISSKLVCHTN